MNTTPISPQPPTTPNQGGAGPTANPAPPSDPSPPVTPWQLQPGESQKAFLAFQEYLELGTNATIKNVAEKTGCSFDSIENFCHRHHWRERAAAWRHHLAQLQSQPLEQLAAASSTLWAQRAQTLRQQQWEFAQNLAQLGQELFLQLLDGKGAAPRPDEVSRIYNTAAKLARQAVEPPAPNLGPSPEDDAANLEFERALKTVYGAMAQSNTIPNLKDQLDRERTQATPAGTHGMESQPVVGTASSILPKET